MISNDRLAYGSPGTRRITADYVPESFSEMFTHYYSYVIRLVVTMGIDSQNAEDVAMAILTTFFEKDALAQYDPNFEGQHKRKVLFRTFLSGFVASYVRHFRDMERVRRVRDLTYIDEPVTSSIDNSSYSWIDLFGPVYEEDFDDRLNEEDLIRQIRARLVATARSNSQDRCDMPDLFDQIVEQSKTIGKVDVKALSERFGVSTTSVQNWIKRLRSEVTLVVSAD